MEQVSPLVDLAASLPPEADLERYDHPAGDDAAALFPALRRDGSRLMTVAGGSLSFRRFSDLPVLLPEGGVLVLNESPVLKTELHAVTLPGGLPVSLNVAGFCPQDSGRVTAFAYPGKRIVQGGLLRFTDGSVAEVCAKHGAEVTLTLSEAPASGGFAALCGRVGVPPLPPYIKKGRRRQSMQEHAPEDEARYRTVYERPVSMGKGGEGSCAAPTAGLHFTPEMLSFLQERGTQVVRLALHVGAGTFLPVKTRDVRLHSMHEERYHLSEEAAERLTRAKREGRTITCAGTTSLRAVESAWDPAAFRMRAGEGSTALFLRPGGRDRARVADGLVTNFHQPRSTLFMLVCALCGTERMRSAYAAAYEAGFRFYSYGDSSLLIPAESLRKYPIR